MIYRHLRFLFLIIIGFCLTEGVHAQVQVSIEDTVISNELNSHIIDVILTNLGSDSVSGFTFEIEYDPSKVFLEGYTKTTLSSGFFVQDNNQDSGIYRITSANSTPIKENGLLIRINAAILDTGKTNLIFNSASVNEGDPEVVPKNGSITVWSYEYPPKPSTPADNSLNTEVSISISWDINPLFQLYEVQLSENENFNPSFVYKGLKENTLQIDDLDFDTRYYWRVKGYSNNRNTEWSNTVSFTTRETPNTRPVISSPISNYILNEDFGTIEIAFLDTVITDLETNKLTFEISSTGKAISHDINNRNLYLESIKDKSGIDTLVVKGIDEEGAYRADTILVEVIAVNDPPILIKSFPLLKFDFSNNSFTFTISEFISDVDNTLLELSLIDSTIPDFIEYSFDTSTDEFTITRINNSLLKGNMGFQIVDPLGASTGLIEISLELMLVSNEVETVRTNSYLLHQNYPNPFNPSTNIQFSLPEASVVELKVFDLTGRELASLVSGMKPAGNHAVAFDAGNLSSGIYIYRLKTGDFIQTKQMLLIK